MANAQSVEPLSERYAAWAPAARVGRTEVPLLNGVDHVARLRETYPRVTPGAIRVEAERVAPGHFRQLGPFMIVDLAGCPAIEIAAGLTAAGVDTRGPAGRVAKDWGAPAMPAAVGLRHGGRDRPWGRRR